MLSGMSDGLREHFEEPVAAPGRSNVLLSAAAVLGGVALAGGWAGSTGRRRCSSRRTGRSRCSCSTWRCPMRSPARSWRWGPTARSTCGCTGGGAVRLDGGELRCDVAHDAARPFQVLARDARIELGAGELTDICDGIAQRPRQGDAAAPAGWRDGWLSFRDTRLREALASVNAYRSAPIVSTDSRVDAMRLTGRFPARDAAGLLALLPQVLPVTVRLREDGGAELAAH
jgi:transmembrane sensor